MTTSPEKHLQELLEDFDVAMFVTQTADGQLRSRPMVLADVEADGTLWFLTQRGSPKMDEIAQDSQVNVALQSSMKYVSLSGRAAPTHDRSKLEEVWNDSWKVWFPGGKDDPGLMLVKVSGETGEYWDNSGSSGISYLIKAGKAYLHGKVSL
jgi:general stress protein 26